MSFFGLFKKPSPSDLSARLFLRSIRVEMGLAETEFLKLGCIDCDRYVTERVIMQTSLVLGLMAHIAREHPNIFFRDTFQMLEKQIETYYLEKSNFGFDSPYSLNSHVRDYYCFDEPQKMFQKMFHRFRKEDYVIKNEAAREILYTPVNLFVMDVREVLSQPLRYFGKGG